VKSCKGRQWGREEEFRAVYIYKIKKAFRKKWKINYETMSFCKVKGNQGLY